MRRSTIAWTVGLPTELDDLGRGRAVVESYLGARQTGRGSPEDFGEMLRGRSWW